MAVATAPSVTPAQATSASSSMSPEHAERPLPPVAGCNPAAVSALPVCTRHVMSSPSVPSAFSVMTAASGVSRYFAFSGACSSLSSSVFMRKSYGVVAAVDAQIRAGHETRSVGGKEESRLRDLLGLAKPVQQVLGTEHFARLLHRAEAQHPLGLDRARRERIHADLLCRVIASHGL